VSGVLGETDVDMTASLVMTRIIIRSHSHQGWMKHFGFNLLAQGEKGADRKRLRVGLLVGEGVIHSFWIDAPSALGREVGIGLTLFRAAWARQD
jgi:hypothetical protein